MPERGAFAAGRKPDLLRRHPMRRGAMTLRGDTPGQAPSCSRQAAGRRSIANANANFHSLPKLHDFRMLWYSLYLQTQSARRRFASSIDAFEYFSICP